MLKKLPFKILYYGPTQGLFPIGTAHQRDLALLRREVFPYLYAAGREYKRDLWSPQATVYRAAENS